MAYSAYWALPLIPVESRYGGWRAVTEGEDVGAASQRGVRWGRSLCDRR